jgi:hypothetical protein
VGPPGSLAVTSLRRIRVLLLWFVDALHCYYQYTNCVAKTRYPSQIRLAPSPSPSDLTLPRAPRGAEMAIALKPSQTQAGASISLSDASRDPYNDPRALSSDVPEIDKARSSGDG